MANIVGTNASNILIGSGPETGDDILRGLLGSDTYQFAPGNGNDVVSEEGDASASIIDRLQFTGRSASSFLFSRSGVDLVIDAGGGDRVTVSRQYDAGAPAFAVERLLDGNSATFRLVAGFTGTTGRDILVGTSGADVLSASDNHDILFGGLGNDTLEAGAGADTLNGGAGDDVLNGGPSTDTASYVDSPSGVTVSLALTGPQATGGAGTDTLLSIENLIGSAHADDLTGGNGRNLINGGAGNDIVFAGAGSDTVNGEAGNDTLVGGAGDDALSGGDGSDTASYAGSTVAVNVSLSIIGGQATGGAGFDTLAGIENLFGGLGNDQLTGDGGNNVLEGAAGNDTLNGGTGIDTLIGGAGNDSIVGGAGDDIIRYLATGFSGDVGAGQTDTVVAEAGDRIDFTGAMEGLLRVGGAALSAAAANVTVGTAFDAGNNVRFNGGRLQIDINGDNQFSAGQDFDIGLSGIGSVAYDAAADEFSFGAGGPPPPPPPPTKKIALTFDDGPDPVYTQQVLAVLDSFDVTATFFVTGQSIGWYPSVLQAVDSAGHQIENHTFDHPDLTELSDAAIRSQFEQTSNAINALTGQTANYFRPPYGSYDSRVESIAASMGLRNTLWTADTNDWQQNGVASIVNAALSQATDNGVILMHDGGGDRSQTVDALDDIIIGLRGQGYEMVTVDQLDWLPVWA
jgi:peptidoglycan/xylan/chitin deacetylase (PgdA/CDA1 family)